MLTWEICDVKRRKSANNSSNIAEHTPVIWGYDGLWQKAKQYVERAYREDREGPLFAFWSSLSLEFLARATLALIHPALLADPNNPENLLFAFGIEKTNKPKSIAITTVFLRCMSVSPEFTKDVSDACTTITERRNSELHSGELAFDGIPTSIWLAQFYKACSILLKSQKKTLADLLPPEEVAAANEMIVGLDRKYHNEAARLIGEAKGRFEKLSQDEQEARRIMARSRLVLVEP
jgi:hypothetical protein